MKSRVKRTLCAAIAVGVVAGASSLVGGQAASAFTLPKTVSLVASGSVTTADKEKWTLTITALNVGVDSSDDVTVQIERALGSDGGYEAHEWTFPVPSSALTFSTSSYKGTLNSGTSANPLASLNLKFTGSSPKKGSCSSGSSDTYSGTLSGELKLVTGLAKGGTIGSSSFKFTAKSPLVIIDAGCVPKTVDTSCSPGIGFDAQSYTSASGVLGYQEVSKHAIVSILNQVFLAAPAGATREDAAGLMTGPVPAYSASKRSLTITSLSSGAITGSGVISGGTKHTESDKCTVGSKKETETDVSYTNATFKDSSSSPLTAHTVLTPKIVEPTTIKDAEFDIDTVS